jgi:hypothetical protein
MSDTVLSRLANALGKAAAGDSHAAAPTTVVLWPDKERLWESVLERAMMVMPELVVLGSSAKCR